MSNLIIILISLVAVIFAIGCSSNLIFLVLLFFPPPPPPSSKGSGSLDEISCRIERKKRKEK